MLGADSLPLKVVSIDGEVVMLGPRVAVTLTAAAAEETARRLAHAAGVAAGQVSTEPDSGAPGSPKARS